MLLAPDLEDRERARQLVGPEAFVEVFVDTPLAECERRDPKGQYARARRGEIAAFTGISARYDVPESPDARIDGHGTTFDEQVDAIMAALGRASPEPQAQSSA